MGETAIDPNRQKQLYWNELVLLKGAGCYMRLYRDQLGRWVTTTGTLKAIASCGSIAAWAIWKEHAFVWGLIIASSQLADALKDVFPFAKKHKAASEYANALSGLFIDAQLEWDVICLGSHTDEDIVSRLHSLRKFQLEAERQNFPNGAETRNSIRVQAEHEAELYLKSTYGLS